ncbi:interleukin-3 receptor class 2 subunit beta-like [Nannospalax galili]|uniref:interleukin-3 receptor class 2 subunit beta-like n=1 Tax=Nannospalax galili TaxID=1026970 RepID=UPI00081A21DA|nr:interleukin-3 receptor class 2 subunit beta-like [Nannospalax galili]
MAVIQGLLRMALLTLFWRSNVTETQNTVPLQTLQCYYDYTSRIICSWADTEDAPELINVTLYHWVNGDSPQPVSCDLSEDLLWSVCSPLHRCVPRRCVISYKSFEVSVEHFSFQLDRSLHTHLKVPLAQHVQPPPPKDIQVSPSGDHDAANLYTNDSWATLEPQLLLPSNTYVARVRTRLSPGSNLSGRPSQWSPDVHWDSQPGDLAQPQNLQCLFDGAQMLNCSWEVRTQLHGSVVFGLFYNSSPDAQEEECSPVEEQQAGLFIRYHCGINVSNASVHSRYTVSVKPRKQGKFIPSSNHIQLPPPTLNLTKDGDSYRLDWDNRRTTHGNMFQVQYRRDLDTWKDSKTEAPQQAHSMLLPALKPATTYWARVRVMPALGYHGIWSEWSKEASWTTEWVLPTWGLALILVFVTLALLMALRFGSVYGYRMNRKWKEKIPNPRKCISLQDTIGGLWPPGSMAAFSRGNCIPQGLQGCIFTVQEGVSFVHLEDSEVSPLTIEDPNMVQDPASGPGMTPAISSEPMEQPPDPQLDPLIPSSRLENQIPSFYFNGPYLGPSHNHSLLGLKGQSVTPETSGSLKPALPGSLVYLCLPPGGQAQLVPMAQVMEQGQAMNVECGPSLGPERNLPMEAGDIPVPPDSGPKVRRHDLEENSVALPMSSGSPEDPMVASGYITPADLITMPTGTAPSVSLSPSLGLPPAPNPSLCPRLPEGLLGSSTSRLPCFEGYMELPPNMSLFPESSLGSLAPPVPSSPVVSLGAPREKVAPVSPHPEGLLVLQQVGDYCLPPSTGVWPLPPQAKPSSPGWGQSSD